MTVRINHWPAYQKRWEFKGTPEEAVIFSGANGGYEARMQYEFMLEVGLRPESLFLDWGCGALRGTVRLVDYLEDGHFFGTDISVGLLTEAIRETQRLKMRHLPLLQVMDSFDLKGLFDERFDFILCNSVTVHIEPEDITDLLHGIKGVLAPGGKAYVSVHPLPETATESMKWDGYRWWYKPSWMERSALEVGLHLASLPGSRANRIPGQRKPVIPMVNSNMTEWMMEGTL